MSPPPRLSVVVTTCFQPESLRLILAGYRAQSFRDFELVVADDGSGDETRRLLDEARQRGDFPVRRVWQPNRGFRKARILNHAVLHTRGPLLVFSDGDCIPHRDFLRIHAESCPEGGYAVGGWVNLTLEETKALTPETIESGGHHDRVSPAAVREMRRIHFWNRFYALFGKRRRPRIRGRNVAVARSALFRINGYDENFDQFSKEDSDLRDRLNMIGAPAASLYGRSWVLHTHNDVDRPHQGSLRKRGKNKAYYDRPGVTAWCVRGLFGKSPDEDPRVRSIVDAGGTLDDAPCTRCGEEESRFEA